MPWLLHCIIVKIIFKLIQNFNISLPNPSHLPKNGGPPKKSVPKNLNQSIWQLFQLS